VLATPAWPERLEKNIGWTPARAIGSADVTNCGSATRELGWLAKRKLRESREPKMTFYLQKHYSDESWV
jgi:hypothetical protein